MEKKLGCFHGIMILLCICAIDAQLSAPTNDPHSSSSWMSSLKGWAHSIKTIAGYIDSFAKEDCGDFECPNGEKTDINPQHVPLTNGCGSFGYNVDKYVADGMIECCNEHDLCFSRCGVKKTKCDEKFKKCLYETCRADDHHKTSLTVCQISAKALYGATMLAGCSSFHTAQSNACICKPRKRSSRADTNHHRNRNEL